MSIMADDISGMVEYWLATPKNSRLGTGFGNNASELIGNPNDGAIADEFVKKMLEDVPILQILPQGAVNIYAVPRDFDGIDLFVEISGQAFPIQNNN